MSSNILYTTPSHRFQVVLSARWCRNELPTREDGYRTVHVSVDDVHPSRCLLPMCSDLLTIEVVGGGADL